MRSTRLCWKIFSCAEWRSAACFLRGMNTSCNIVKFQFSPSSIPLNEESEKKLSVKLSLEDKEMFFSHNKNILFTSSSLVLEIIAFVGTNGSQLDAVLMILMKLIFANSRGKIRSPIASGKNRGRARSVDVIHSNLGVENILTHVQVSSKHLWWRTTTHAWSAAYSHHKLWTSARVERKLWRS